MITVHKKFQFDAAHYLPLTDKTHKCYNMHGHTYSVCIYISADNLNELGWVVDFTEIKRHFKPILEKLDHSCLNNIQGLENPTCENLAIWIYNELKNNLDGVTEIRVEETTSSGCTYKP